MSSLIKYIIIAAAALVVTSCAQDPSVFDLKSPCVSNDDGSSNAPCVKRKPLENEIA